MDDWLIFQYHFIRAQAESSVLREPRLRVGLPTPLEEASEGGTQEGRWAHAMVVVGQACREASQANPGGRQS
jgi:hypothetical protein